MTSGDDTVGEGSTGGDGTTGGPGTSDGGTTTGATGDGSTGDASSGTTGVVEPDPECENGLAEVGEFCLGAYTETDLVNPATDLVAADFDDNDNIDIFTGAGPDGEFETLLGNGAGLFSMGPYDVTGGPEPYFVARGRLNNDAFPDMIWASDDTDGVAVVFNDGFGTLTDGVDNGVYPFDTINSISVGDVDGNNYTDIVVSTQSGSYLLRANGMGSGVLTQSTIFGNGNHSDAVVAELNGNAAMDVAIVNGMNLRFEFGTNNGLFPTNGGIGLGAMGDRVAAGDVDGDGDTDLAVTVPGVDAVRVMEGAGNGDFMALMSLATGSRASDVLLEDFNGDGRDDVVVSNAGDDTLSVYLSDPAGGFENVRTLNLSGASEREPGRMTVADLNEDGALDIAVALGVDAVGLFLSDV